MPESMPETPAAVRAQCEHFRTTFNRLKAEIGKVVVGHAEVVDGVLSALFAGGNVLLEDQVLHQGEVVVDASGVIACAACDCSQTAGYLEATRIECGSNVISPGLINAHDHISYANTPPQAHGTERYEHRHDWRKGRDGHMPLRAPGGASVNRRCTWPRWPSSTTAARPNLLWSATSHTWRAWPRIARETCTSR